jgi:hypothetical protein
MLVPEPTLSADAISVPFASRSEYVLDETVAP